MKKICNCDFYLRNFYLLYVIVVFFSLFFLPQNILAGIIGKGIANIFNQNEGLAKQQALKNAQRDAVEKGVGLILDSKSILQNYQLIRDEIYTSSQGFVTSYKVIQDEKSLDGKSWEITIDAEVQENQIKNRLTELRILHQKMGNKRFAILYKEYRTPLPQRLSSQHHAVSSTEIHVSEEFTQAGFRLFELNSIQNRIQSNSSLESILQEIETLGIQILIEFEVFASKNKNFKRKQINAAQATVRLTAYDVNTKQKIANQEVFSKQLTNASLNSYDWIKALSEASSRAGREAAVEAVEQIVTFYKSVGDIGNSYFIEFKNYTQNEEDALLQLLENLEGYQSLTELNNQPGYLSIEYFSTNIKTRLRRNLINSAKKLKQRIQLQSKSISGNRLSFIKPGTQ